MSQVRVVVVGGFLGAGKTSLLRLAGRRLAAEGLRVGVIVNDQAGDLVDSETLRREGFGVEEVSGGCFCCRFSQLAASARQLLERHRPEVLLCEPVGSCTDLAATVLRPLRAFLPKSYAVAPYSVLVDPARLRELLARGPRGALSEKVLYIYNKQLEEADLILLNKDDLLAPEESAALRAELARRFPHAEVLGLSALHGGGLDAWLEALGRGRAAGQRGIVVDYDVYAAGEAELGWLNAAVRLKSLAARQWKPVCLDLLRALKDRLHARSAEIVHVKLALTAPGQALTGNLTSTRGQPFLLVQGTAEEPAATALLLLNARVQIAPDELKAAVREALAALAARGVLLEVERLECFRPGRPVPEHRLPPVEACSVGAENPCGILREIFKPRKAARLAAEGGN